MKSYIRVAQLATMLGVSESTVWRWAGNKLPQPTKISKRVTVWAQDEVQKAIDEMGGEI